MTAMPPLRNLGAALRHLRLHGASRERKQNEVAEAAGITRAMLSSYENDRREPTVSTLGRLLDALGADFTDLQWAMEIVSRSPRDDADEAPYPSGPRTDHDIAEGPPSGRVVYRVVDLPPLAEGEEEALGELLAGFRSYVRVLRGAGIEPAEPDGD